MGDDATNNGISPRLSRRQRREAGREQRNVVPLEVHAELNDTPRDAVATLRAQDAGRISELVPIRWGRMSVSPFTFYRGAAGLMAFDLASSPRTDLTVQLCGDAHLSNFGVFAAPDRRLVFDLNDFDETLPGPFEWDVKRLVASVVVAGRGNGLTKTQCAVAATTAVRSYRTTIARAAAMNPLDIWYSRVELDELQGLAQAAGKGSVRQLKSMSADAMRKDQLGALAKLTEVIDGRRRIRQRRPLIFRFAPDDYEAEVDNVGRFFNDYLDTLSRDRRVLLERYSVTDLAVKVVGVGSVGMRCLVALCESGDDEPLFLQIKQAGASVLEAYLGAADADRGGRRVVEGQRIVQSAFDPFLGWATYHGGLGTHDYYVRQLWDGKASARVDRMGAKTLANYADLCGAVLARAHARSGDAETIRGYLGSKDRFDRAITAFATRYAARTERDHASTLEAIAAGHIEVVADT